MAAMEERSCKRCEAKFTARTADVKRGWALYCSRHCKAVTQEKRTGQYRAFKSRTSDSYHDENYVGHPFESGYFGHGQE